VKPPGTSPERHFVANTTKEGEDPPGGSGTAAAPAKVPRVPDYELVRRIGHGAYGEVWLARSKATGILRAAKIVWRHSFSDDRPFRREFEGVQRFERISREHPSQLALFHIGTDEAEECFYYVMELADRVKGTEQIVEIRPNAARAQSPGPNDAKSAATDYSPRTLRSDLAGGRLPAGRVLELGLALSEALSHLHRNGLVHRDVKPSNVIFVNGRPKLADIGLVTDASDQCSIVGTEGYLPPEGCGTHQADIFALGKLLYEATTGLDRRQFPDLPSNLKEWPDAALVFELNDVFLKASANDARARYASVETMLSDLRALEKGKSVKQRRAWERRARATWKVGTVTAAIVAVAAGGILLWQTVTRQSTLVIVPSNEVAAKAYQLGFNQMRLGTAQGFRDASSAFTKAIAAEPRFVAAYAGLFEACLISEEREVAFKAGQSNGLKELAATLAKLAPMNAEAHAARASVLWLNERKLSEAERDFNRAIEADPGSAMALTCYGYFLTQLGRHDEARKVLDRALVLDSTSPLILKLLGDHKGGTTVVPNESTTKRPATPK
jgi:serine/threonine protein kinase